MQLGEKILGAQAAKQQVRRPRQPSGARDRCPQGLDHVRIWDNWWRLREQGTLDHE
jgi:hypothetical protein